MRRLDGRMITGVLATVIVLAGCGQPLTQREKGALAGGALGAGTGAIIGSTRGDAAEGAAIGGAIGALGGGLLGHQLEGQDQRAREQDERLRGQEQEIAENRRLIEELKRRKLDVRETSRGVVVNLPDILFEFDRADLTREARGRIRDIAEVVNEEARDRDISVEGHTDSIGSDAYNQRLSEARAERVRDELAAQGVAPRRIRARGFGESRPVAPNTRDGRDNPEGRARNRRVEVVIEN